MCPQLICRYIGGGGCSIDYAKASEKFKKYTSISIWPTFKRIHIRVNNKLKYYTQHIFSYFSIERATAVVFCLFLFQ